MSLKFDFTFGFAKPPVATNLYKFSDLNLDVLRKIKCSIHETIEKLKDDNEVKTEAEILRKLHYKFKNQWRREKLLKSIKQVYNVWMKFKSINILELLNELKDLIPNRNCGQETSRLPSFQLVCYDLSILLRCCALLKECSDLCVVGCSRAQQQISNYLFPQYMTICYASLSKFCCLCTILVDVLSDCYKNIRGLDDVLGVPSNLAKGFGMLPADVKSWLGSDAFFQFHISELFSSKDASGMTSTTVAMTTSLHSKVDPVATDSMLLTSKTSPGNIETIELLTTRGDDDADVMIPSAIASDDDDYDEDREGEEDDDGQIKVSEETQTKKRKIKNGENKKKKLEKMDLSNQGEEPSVETPLEIGQEEKEKITADINGCSTIGQLLSFVREFKILKEGSRLKGFKLCLNKLKSMKDELKYPNSGDDDDDESSNLKKKKKLLLKKSKNNVKKFLDKNSS